MSSLYINQNKQGFSRWISSSLIYFSLIIISITSLMVVANLGMFNNLQFPITDMLPLLSEMFSQSPWQTLVIFSNKTIIAIGQADMRSGLYLWTLELDLNTILTYTLVAGLAARIFYILPHKYSENRSIHLWTYLALGLLIISRTYVTVLAHCAGPTWIGYVALYGTGLEEITLTSAWQWIIAIIACLITAMLFKKTSKPSQTVVSHPEF